MKALTTLVLFVVGFANVIILPPACIAADEAKPDDKSKTSLDDAYLAWQKGFSSTDKKEREKTLRSMLPTKKDVAYLFPKNVNALWSLFERQNQLLQKNIDRLAKEFNSGGKITKLMPIDIRKEETKSSKRFGRVLAMIPQQVPVFRLVTEREKGASGSSTYLYVNNRWIWINGLEELPDVIEKTR
jgi:hypothetical protein